jgi:ParB family chromosome partitioning protein
LISTAALHQAAPPPVFVADGEALPAAERAAAHFDAAPPASLGASGVEVLMVNPTELTPNPFQPRRSLSDQDIAQLAQSIRMSGLLQPIIVRRSGEGLQIIAGERRWLAARSLGMKRVPVILRPADDAQMLEFALVENLQREDLNPIDRATAYRDFCDRFYLKPEEVAERLGEDRTTVVNYLRMLELPPEVRELLRSRRLSMGHARPLLGLDDSARQAALAAAVVRGDLSVRTVESLVRREKQRTSEPAGAVRVAHALDPGHLADLQRRFEQVMKTKVRIQPGKRRGSGRITIEYYSIDDFDRIARQLGVKLEE